MALWIFHPTHKPERTKRLVRVIADFIYCFCLMFALWGNCIFLVATSCDFSRRGRIFMLIILFWRFTDTLYSDDGCEQSDCTRFHSSFFWCDDMICIQPCMGLVIMEFSREWLLRGNSGRMPGCKFRRWSDEFKSGKSNTATVLWVLILYLLPRAHTDSINLTWWSLRPRTILNKRPWQSDRLIYREHDTHVTTLFIFSLCQRIKMQGVFVMPW